MFCFPHPIEEWTGLFEKKVNFRPNDINHKRKDRLGRMKGRVGGSAGGDRRGGECSRERKGGEEDGSRGREAGAEEGRKWRKNKLF